VKAFLNKPVLQDFLGFCAESCDSFLTAFGCVSN